MITESVAIPQCDVQKLLGAANPDAALLYIFINSGNDPKDAAASLRLTESRLNCAAATLRQLGMWPEERPVHILSGERPCYTEADVIRSMETDETYRRLFGEVQRNLGRTLNTEEMKIVLGFIRYLGLSVEVIGVLINYCKTRAQRKGSSRNPSLRSIEKEAYAWAERGIDTMEEAAAYVNAQNLRDSRLGQLMKILQIRGRNLTGAETRYAQSWLDMGFEDSCFEMAYERTCLNTGGLNWAYMNKILQRWHEQGLHTAEAVRSGDQRKAIPKGASGQLGSAELEAIHRTLQEG